MHDSMRLLCVWLVWLSVVFSLSVSPLLAVAAAEQSLTLDQQVSALTAELNRLRARVNGQSGVPPLSSSATEKIINDSISWLIATQEENGHFRYEYAPYEDRYLDDDNIVRQAGALYVLGEALRREESDGAAIEAAMIRSIGYFEALSKEGTYNGKTFRCITEDKNSARCKLGATSLALIGMTSLVEHNDEYRDTYDKLIGSYIGFIQAMQKENGGFRNLFNVEDDIQSDAESSFSNGEALLALVRYHSYHPNKTTKKDIDETFTYLKEDVPFDIPLYLWVMVAVADLYKKEPRAEYEDYIKAYTDWRVTGFVDRRGTEHNMCAYTEGVALAYDVLEEFLSEPTLVQYRDELTFWLTKGSTLQVGNDDQYRVLFTNDIPSFSMIKNQARAYGGFLTSESVLTERIDFTQHCLNAYLVWNAAVR